MKSHRWEEAIDWVALRTSHALGRFFPGVATSAAGAKSGDAAAKVGPARPPWAAGAALALPCPALGRLSHVG